MPRFSLFTMFAFVAAACVLMAFPRYFLAVSALFLAVLLLLAFIGWHMGPLPQEKLDEYKRLATRKDSGSEYEWPPESEDHPGR